MGDRQSGNPFSPSTPQDLLKDLIRHGPAEWPATAPADWSDEFLAQCNAHGVGALLFQIQNPGGWEGWPTKVAHDLRRSERGARLLEILYHSELATVLQRLNETGVEVLVLKGTALAYSLYPQPHLRPRSDTDFLVREDELDAVREVLEERGYQPSFGVSGSTLLSQKSFERQEPNGCLHSFDFHWRLSNVQMFREIIDVASLFDRAIPLPGLCAAARTLNQVDKLLHACIHRVAHHGGSNRIIWLYDLCLLTETLDEAQSHEFTAQAEEKKVTAICRNAIITAWEQLGERTRSGWLSRWCRLKSPADEATASFIKRGHQRSYIFWSDFYWAPGLHAKVRLAREHLFPPADYMFDRYSTNNRWLLPLLYARRAVQGLWKILRGN